MIVYSTVSRVTRITLKGDTLSRRQILRVLPSWQHCFKLYAHQTDLIGGFWLGDVDADSLLGTLTWAEAEAVTNFKRWVASGDPEQNLFTISNMNTGASWGFLLCRV